MNQKSYNYIFAILAAIIAFSVYLATLAPTVWFIDSGELAAVASTLGIAHPTGYPLFTIIGHIFTLLPFSDSEIYKLNIMSAFFCALGVFVFFLLIRYLISNSEQTFPAGKSIQDKGKKNTGGKNQPAKTSSKKSNEIPDIIAYGAAGFAALVLAFSKTFWGQANSVEVYPIHIFFVITLMFVFLKALFNTKKSGEESFISQN
jgi:uncharacterized oligopeptide transporter (OPT) family protein